MTQVMRRKRARTKSSPPDAIMRDINMSRTSTIKINGAMAGAISVGTTSGHDRMASAFGSGTRKTEAMVRTARLMRKKPKWVIR